jgi:hypothetical protein
VTPNRDVKGNSVRAARRSRAGKVLEVLEEQIDVAKIATIHERAGETGANLLLRRR